MIEINLIPDVKRELIKAQKVRSLVISSSILISIAVVGAVVLLALYVFGGQLLRNNLADSEIDKRGEELSQVEDLPEILTLQNQLMNISDLQNEKQINSRIFKMLEAVIPPGVNEAKISRFSVEKDTSTIRLEGQTRSFDSMEVFKKTIDAAEIVFRLPDSDETSHVKLASDINTSETSFGEDVDGNRTFRFSLTFAYPPELFAVSSGDISFRLVVNGNVTDSYLGIPKTVFTEPARDVEEGEN